MPVRIARVAAFDEDPQTQAETDAVVTAVRAERANDVPAPASDRKRNAVLQRILAADANDPFNGIRVAFGKDYSDEKCAEMLRGLRVHIQYEAPPPPDPVPAPRT